MSEETKFESWVKGYGVRRLVTEMRAQGHSITESGVYHWLRGQHEPRGPKVRSMVKLAAGGITSQDIMDHFILKSDVAVAR